MPNIPLDSTKRTENLQIPNKAYKIHTFGDSIPEIMFLALPDTTVESPDITKERAQAMLINSFDESLPYELQPWSVGVKKKYAPNVISPVRVTPTGKQTKGNINIKDFANKFVDALKYLYF